MDEIFVDTTPSGPDGTANQSSEVADSETKKTPYTIVVSDYNGVAIKFIFVMNSTHFLISSWFIFHLFKNQSTNRTCDID